MSLFLRIFFRLLYHEFAWLYDLVSASVSGGRWQAWINSILPLVQDPDILELGSGPGHLLFKFRQNKFHAIGLDSSRQMIALARKKLIRNEFDPCLVRGSGQALPFCAQSFDFILATFPTEFIFKSSSLLEINRLLRSGGSLIILISAWITSRSLVSRFLAWLFRITGQTLSAQIEEERLLKPFTDTGMHARLHWVNLPDSRLLFVIVTKITPKV